MSWECPYCAAFPEAGPCSACEHVIWGRIPRTATEVLEPKEAPEGAEEQTS